MKLNLKEKPQGVKIIVGFPGFGLVGTISTKYLIEHLDVKDIGSVESTKLLPIAAIHKGKLIGPLDIFYEKKHNIVILQILSDLSGFEWQLADVVEELVNDLNAKEVIVLEGIPAKSKSKKTGTFYYCNNKDCFSNFNLKPLEEGVMMGTTATLLLKSQEININCIFVESTSQMPDSEAAAKSIDVINKYLGLKVDYKPLISAAKRFESMMKTVMSNQPGQQKPPAYKTEESDLDYLG